MQPNAFHSTQTQQLHMLALMHEFLVEQLNISNKINNHHHFQ
jgi:hypothetical protein